MKENAGWEEWKEAKYSIPDKIVGQVLLKLIHLTGYRLFVKWSGGYGKRMDVGWKLRNKL